MSSHSIETDPYAVLGLPHGASIKAVLSAFKILVKAYHPENKKFI